MGAAGIMHRENRTQPNGTEQSNNNNKNNKKWNPEKRRKMLNKYSYKIVKAASHWINRQVGWQSFVTFMSYSGKCLISVDKSNANWDRLTLSLDNKFRALFFSNQFVYPFVLQPLPIFALVFSHLTDHSLWFVVIRCDSLFSGSTLFSIVLVAFDVYAIRDFAFSVAIQVTGPTFVCHAKFY